MHGIVNLSGSDKTCKIIHAPKNILIQIKYYLRIINYTFPDVTQYKLRGKNIALR